MSNTLQQELAVGITNKFPDAVVKKIDKDNYLDIHLPSVHPKRGTHLGINTAKGLIKIVFYCREDQFNEQVLANSKKIEAYGQGLRIKDNPTFTTLEKAIKAAIDFVLEIKRASGKQLTAKQKGAIKKGIKLEEKNPKITKSTSKKNIKSKDTEQEDYQQSAVDLAILAAIEGKSKNKKDKEHVFDDSDDADTFEDEETNDSTYEDSDDTYDIDKESEENYQWICYNLKGEEQFKIQCAHIYSIGENKFGVEKGGRYGVIDKKGNLIVDYKYDQIDSFCEGFARVQIGGRWTGQYGYIDSKGKEVIKCQFDDADAFSDGYARVKINDNWGFIDKKGVQIIKPKYDFAYDFSEGLAGVTKNDLIGFIDAKDNVVIDFKFDSIEKFNGGVSVIQMGGRNKNGEWVSGKYGLIDKKGNLLTESKYDEIKPFKEGLALVIVGGTYGKNGFINKNGKEIIPCVYDFANDFINGAAFVRKNDKSFLIDKMNNIVSADNYETISNYYDDLSAVSNNDKYGFINKKGALVIKLSYDSVSDFNVGYASFQKNGLWGVINKNGDVELKPIYDEIEFIPYYPITIVKEQNKYKVIHLNKEYSIPESFDEIRLLDNEYLICKSDVDTSLDLGSVTGEEILSKKELLELLWDKVGGFIYDYSYTTDVTEDEADYIENRGLGCKNLGKQKNGMIKIKINLESYIDTNFKTDFLDHFNLDKISGNKVYSSKQLEDWINKCFGKLCDLFAGFAVMGGDVLYPEYGDNPWENEKTIYLEVTSKEFRLIDLKGELNKKRYFLDEQKMKKLANEINF